MIKQTPIDIILFDIGGVVVRSPLLAIERYETAQGLPRGYINWNIYHSGPGSAWKKLERNEIPMNDAYFNEFSSDLNSSEMWRKFHEEKGITQATSEANIDAKWLFWDMMRVSREFDPDMLHAIQKLKETKKYKIGALTNNYVFPEGHPYGNDTHLRNLFDVYIASVEVGMRKPEHRIFDYAIKALGAKSASQIVFLDDLGGNLRTAKAMGINTIKVPLNDTRKAIEELEAILGEALSLATSSKL